MSGFISRAEGWVFTFLIACYLKCVDLAVVQHVINGILGWLAIFVEN